MKRRNFTQRKPTGIIRDSGIALTPGQPAVIEHREVKLPESKNDAETTIMKGFHSLCGQADWMPCIVDFRKFPTDHGPDFILDIEDGTTAYAELFEIAILKNGDHSKADRVRSFQSYVDHFLEQLAKKVIKYSERGYSPIYLLSYPTDSIFQPNEAQTKALCRRIRAADLGPFASVFIVFPCLNDQFFVVDCRSFGSDLKAHEAKRIYASQMVAIDYTKTSIIEDKSAGDYIDVTFRVELPPGIDMKQYLKLAQRGKFSGMLNVWQAGSSKK